MNNVSKLRKLKKEVKTQLNELVMERVDKLLKGGLTQDIEQEIINKQYKLQGAVRDLTSAINRIKLS